MYRLFYRISNLNKFNFVPLQVLPYNISNLIHEITEMELFCSSSYTQKCEKHNYILG